MPIAPLGSKLQNRGTTQIAVQGIYEQSETKKHRLGERIVVDDRVFRYCKASEALSAGDKVSAVATRMHEDTLTEAVALGTRDVTITEPNVSDYVANYFEDGYLVITDGTGAGYTYKASGHGAIPQNETFVLLLYDGVHDALDTTTDVTLYASPFLVQIMNDLQEFYVGVAPIDVTSGYYLWACTYGPMGTVAAALGAADDERILTVGAQVLYKHTAGSPIFGEAVLDAADMTASIYQLVFVKCIP